MSVEPALSAEEWAAGKTERGFRFMRPEDWFDEVWLIPPGDVPMLLVRKPKIAAAICLDGQEYGFTWEDVRRLRAQADWYEENTEGVVYACPHEMMPAWQLRNHADRLEALLRPES